MFGGYSHRQKRKKCGFSSSTTKRKKHKANEKRRFNQKAREINLFSPCDSALTVLTSDAINLSKFIEASEQRLQSRYFSDTPRIYIYLK